ncbi:hypothetical protein IRY61_01345 [Candidatus Saccharibacteria bacterium]|nr:hypothetical protein [Candidatus Saccharibacteria bacterium]
MTTALQLRRGTTAQHSSFVGAQGEVTVDTDKNVVVVHDGVTPGGTPAAKESDVAVRVRFDTDEQGLTSEQQANARKNIGLDKVANKDLSNVPNYPLATSQEALDGVADRLITPDKVHEIVAAKASSVPIGMPFPVWTHIGAPAPTPAENFIRLVAGQSGPGGYNEGKLHSESVSGTSPNVTATAVINALGSPMHGQTVHLIETEERFIRAGFSGRLQDSENLLHGHTVSGSTASAGAHSHSASVVISSGGNSSGGGLIPGYGGSPTTYTVSVSSAGEHTHTLSGTTGSQGASEARPRNIGASYYMRIK